VVEKHYNELKKATNWNGLFVALGEHRGSIGRRAFFHHYYGFSSR